MDKNADMFNYYGFSPQYINNPGMYDTGMDPSMNMAGNMDSNAMFNPLMQYEQAYMYYRYLSQQMEYKIRCKEYEKLCSKPENMRDSSRKLE